jgi:hypothetical protein
MPKPKKKSPSKYSNGRTFQKGNGRKVTRVGVTNKMSRECKEMIQNCFEGMGGLEGLIKWATSTPERTDAFYTRMYIRLLPVNLDIRSHKDVVYHSVQDIQERFGQVGMSLELIERLRREEAAQPKLIEHVRVD